MYSVIASTKRELQEDLYDDTEIDTTLADTDTSNVVPWIDGAVGQSFTEDDLIGDDALIRLASCKYCAYSMMSSVLEGHNIESISLALHRLAEAKELVTMWANGHGIIPTFSDEDYVPVGVDFAVEVGSDSETIG
jgi:hypothetical protein